MWQEICLANADNICIVLDRYIRSLTDFRFAIRNENGEKLLQYFSDCRAITMLATVTIADINTDKSAIIFS